jgi:single-strand DNA-binding protein
MSGSVNKVIIIGRVGADPEIRRTQDGRPIANLRVATSEQWRDRNTGERKEKTEWHSVVVLNEGLAKVVEQYVKKGALIYVEGQLQTRKWQDQNGNDRYSTEVVLGAFNSTLTMMDGQKNDGDKPKQQASKPRQQNMRYGDDEANSYGRQPNDYSDMDDEIPF